MSNVHTLRVIDEHSTSRDATVHEFMDIEILRESAKQLIKVGHYTLEVDLADGRSYEWGKSYGWIDLNAYYDAQAQHKCVIQETPDGMGCVVCLYH